MSKKLWFMVLWIVVLAALPSLSQAEDGVNDWIRFETKIGKLIFYDYVKLGPISSRGLVLGITNHGARVYGYWKDFESGERLYFIGRGKASVYLDSWVFSTKTGYCRHQGSCFFNETLHTYFHESKYSFIPAPPTIKVPDLVQQRKKKALRK